jgi:Mg2+-importing ATPase
MVDPCGRGRYLRDPVPRWVSALFGFVPLSAAELAVVVAIVGGYIVATEIAKAWFFRHENGVQSAPPTDPGGQS